MRVMRQRVGLVAGMSGRLAITMSIPPGKLARIPSGVMAFLFVGSNDSIVIGLYRELGWGIVVVTWLIDV